MEFKPNSISQDAAKVIVAKFTQYNKGVVMGNSSFISHSPGSRDYDAYSAKWNDLISESNNQYSIQAIHQKMMHISSIINGLPEDDVLGDTSVHYSFRTDRGKKIQIKWTDEYIFLREALRERKETQTYKEKQKKLATALKYIEENKPQDAKLKEAQDLVASLSKELGEDEDATPVTENASQA